MRAPISGYPTATILSLVFFLLMANSLDSYYLSIFIYRIDRRLRRRLFIHTHFFCSICLVSSVKHIHHESSVRHINNNNNNILCVVVSLLFLIIFSFHILPIIGAQLISIEFLFSLSLFIVFVVVVERKNGLLRQQIKS